MDGVDIKFMNLRRFCFLLRMREGKTEIGERDTILPPAQNDAIHASPKTHVAKKMACNPSYHSPDTILLLLVVYGKLIYVYWTWKQFLQVRAQALHGPPPPLTSRLATPLPFRSSCLLLKRLLNKSKNLLKKSQPRHRTTPNKTVNQAFVRRR